MPQLYLIVVFFPNVTLKTFCTQQMQTAQFLLSVILEGIKNHYIY